MIGCLCGYGDSNEDFAETFVRRHGVENAGEVMCMSSSISRFIIELV